MIGAKAERRFWSKVVIHPSGCLVWAARLNHAGYGQVHVHGHTVKAHRLAYELLVGPIPTGLEIDHLCRNRACVHPDHLEPVTHTENTRRGARGGALLIACPYGHPYDEANTHINWHGRRECRVCRERWRETANARRRAREAAARAAAGGAS